MTTAPPTNQARVPDGAARAPRHAAIRSGHVARIVAGSLLGGMIGAFGLVVGPLAGAREHVITGAVLVTFGLSWAALAVLSTRWTDQPQRWAFAPAACMALAGATVVGLAPTGNPFGWVWPPALIALVAWMVVRMRRDLHSRAGTLLLSPVLAVLLLSALGGGYETFREGSDRASHPMPGRLVDVGDHRLHIDCSGAGSPTVVLEGGLGEPSSVMAGWIAPDVAATTRVCVYDRAGRGWSESASRPRDGVGTATDLHTLLERAGEPGPYVLAGHSAGGIYVLTFARLFPEQVAGMVLLDSMSPQQYTRIATWPAFYEMFRRVSAVLPPLSRLGVGRALYASAYGGLPARQRAEERAFWATPRHGRSLRDEFAAIRTAMGQADALESLGERPLLVVTAQEGAAADWLLAQEALVGLSANSEQRVLAGVTHAMLVEDRDAAGRSAQAIVDVVGSVRTGVPVSR